MRQVLSEAAQRHANKVLQGTANNKAVVVSSYIPIPDSTGVVDNYERLYPVRQWQDPTTFVFSSETCEEAIRGGLANGFTYYMDERDKEWLDKNNEEARGEGTSAQGTILSPTGTRTSARSAKAKGKEPDVVQPVPITEDEFELTMGLFEKVTHEKTEFLHHVRFIVRAADEKEFLILAVLRAWRLGCLFLHSQNTRRYLRANYLTQFSLRS